jgi:hypothetical protein
MSPPERYSVHPLPAFATSPPGFPKPLPLHRQFVHVWNWLRGVRPDQHQQQREHNIVAGLVAEIEAEDAGGGP